MIELCEQIGHPSGSDLTVINTTYRRPLYLQNGDMKKPIMQILYRNNETGEKEVREIEDPLYEYYIAKDNTYISNPELFYDKGKLDRVVCKFTDLEKDIAERTGNLSFYYDNIKCGNRSANRRLHEIETVFGSDTHIEDKYRFMFGNVYKNNTFEITRAYIDIETDIKDMLESDDIQSTLGHFPINAITYVDLAYNTVYTYLLRNRDYNGIDDFEKKCASGIFDNQMRDFVRERVGGWKNEVRYKLDKVRYKQMFFNDEIEMLKSLFDQININKPDFMLAWNMAFDIPYIIERIKRLNYNPEDIMCHPDYKEQQCYYYIDEMHRNDPEQKGDYACISSYTIYLDQLIHWASRRKGQAKPPNFKLETIGQITTKIGKLDWSHICKQFKDFCYVDYETFVMYNIMDTLVQHCIEVKCDDIGYLFNKALINNTRFNKAHRQTVYLVNRANKEFYNSGLVMGNNMNRNNSKPTTKFPGALVGNPVRIDPSTLIHVNGIPTRLFNNGDDFDFAALYPSCIHEFNIGPNTQYGKMYIESKVHERENKFRQETYDRGGDFLNDMQSRNYLELSHRWFHLADYAELIEDVKEYFTHHKRSFIKLRNYDPMTGLKDAVRLFKEYKEEYRDIARVTETENTELRDVVIVRNDNKTVMNKLEGIVYEDLFYNPYEGD